MLLLTAFAQGYERAGLLSSDDVNLVQKITSGKANSESLLEQVRRLLL